MKREILLALLIAMGGLTMAVGARQVPSSGGLPAAALAATQIQKVRDNLYMITGSDPTSTRRIQRWQHRRVHHSDRCCRG